MNLHSTLLSLDNNDNVDGKFIAEFDIIKAMIGVDEELLMDSHNYIDENFHLISYKFFPTTLTFDIFISPKGLI